MKKILKIINRDKELFFDDINSYKNALKSTVSSASFLILGGAGSIGQAVVKEIFKRSPKKPKNANVVAILTPKKCIFRHGPFENHRKNVLLAFSA